VDKREIAATLGVKIARTFLCEAAQRRCALALSVRLAMQFRAGSAQKFSAPA
jgi:hypothetical protein